MAKLSPPQDPRRRHLPHTPQANPDAMDLDPELGANSQTHPDQTPGAGIQSDKATLDPLVTNPDPHQQLPQPEEDPAGQQLRRETASSQTRRRNINEKMDKLRTKVKSSPVETSFVEWKPTVLPDPRTDATELGLDTEPQEKEVQIKQEKEESGRDEQEEGEPNEAQKKKGRGHECDRCNRNLPISRELSPEDEGTQRLGWDQNDAHPHRGPTLDWEKIGAERREKEALEAWERECTSWPDRTGYRQVRAEAEAQMAQVLQEALAKAGANPPGVPRHLPESTVSPTPPTPTDSQVVINRFGTPERFSPPRSQAPKISPGGRHMGEGSQGISLENTFPQQTPGPNPPPQQPGELSFRLTTAKVNEIHGQIQGIMARAVPAPRVRVPPAVPAYFASSSDLSSGPGTTSSSVPVVRSTPQPLRNAPTPPPPLVLPKGPHIHSIKTPTPTPSGTADLLEHLGRGIRREQGRDSTMDAEGDTPMRDSPVGLITPPPASPVETVPPHQPPHPPGPASNKGRESNPISLHSTPDGNTPMRDSVVTLPPPLLWENKKGGLARIAKDYGKKNPDTIKPYEDQRNTRKGDDRRGLRESTPMATKTTVPKENAGRCINCGNLHRSKCRYEAKDRCVTCEKFHTGECWKEGKYGHVPPPPQFNRAPHQVKPLPTPAPQKPHAATNNYNGTNESTHISTHKFQFIGTGKNCPAVTATPTMKNNWRNSYNRILQGTGIHVDRVEVDQRFPRERILTIISRLGETETRTAISKHFTKEGVFEKIFKEKEYPEVVVREYVVQGGYVTSAQVYGVMQRLKELNPGLKLGPRYPAFLAILNEPAQTASLRICLDTDHLHTTNTDSLTINIDSPTGEVVRARCQKYTRTKSNQGRYRDGEYYVTTHNDIYHQEHDRRPRYGRWSPPPHHNAKPGLEVKCYDCGRIHTGSCTQPTEPKEQAWKPPYGECFKCGDKSHWAWQCLKPRRY